MILPWTPEYEEYLRDESRRVGNAESISFPRNEAEVIDSLREARDAGRLVTTQGARTGITAGAVPDGGHILNLNRMKNMGSECIAAIAEDSDDPRYSLVVQPGVLLSDIREAAARRGLFFPPDPTEASASIGGMAACNASGAISFHYGATRNWVQSLRLVLSDGDVLHISRGKQRAQNRFFSLQTEGSRLISGSLPAYSLPKVKTAAGYYVADDMDLVDLFIGMEGTLGVITEIELILIPKPAAMAGLTIFLPSEETALKLVKLLRGGVLSIPPVAIEYFNQDALNLIRESNLEKLPAFKPHYRTAVNTEFHGESEESLEETVMELMEALVEFDVSDEDTWYATTERELGAMKAFRHATPEAVNLLIDQRKKLNPELTKLGTDFSVPDSQLDAVMMMYGEGLRDNGLESVIFGHIGNNHVHVNILPNNQEEYERGQALYLQWARKVVEMGGSVSGEHGIGKLKRPFLELMYGSEAVSQMRALKELFDHEKRLNPGNLF